MTTIGIDFGAKLAGTTAICFEQEGRLQFATSKRGEDADRFVLDFCTDRPRLLVGLDAPLSLPLVYLSGGTEGDYLFREADRALGAMSPMFLGGLTARAMRIAAQLSTLGHQVIEVYPKALIATIPDLGERYSGAKGRKSAEELALLTEELQRRFELPETNPPATWHQFDSLLAFISARRHQAGKATSFGAESEGLIVV